ncbi:MAG: hypothetical protein NW701_15560, partial [Nitrospira sp.]
IGDVADPQPLNALIRIHQPCAHMSASLSITYPAASPSAIKIRFTNLFKRGKSDWKLPAAAGGDQDIEGEVGG